MNKSKLFVFLAFVTFGMTSANAIYFEHDLTECPVNLETILTKKLSASQKQQSLEAELDFLSNAYNPNSKSEPNIVSSKPYQYNIHNRKEYQTAVAKITKKFFLNAKEADFFAACERDFYDQKDKNNKEYEASHQKVNSALEQAQNQVKLYCSALNFKAMVDLEVEMKKKDPKAWDKFTEAKRAYQKELVKLKQMETISEFQKCIYTRNWRCLPHHKGLNETHEWQSIKQPKLTVSTTCPKVVENLTLPYSIYMDGTLMRKECEATVAGGEGVPAKTYSFYVFDTTRGTFVTNRKDDIKKFYEYFNKDESDNLIHAETMINYDREFIGLDRKSFKDQKSILEDKHQDLLNSRKPFKEFLKKQLPEVCYNQNESFEQDKISDDLAVKKVDSKSDVINSKTTKASSKSAK